MIRQATEKDLEAVMSLVTAYYQESALKRRTGVPLNQESLKQHALAHILGKNYLTLVSESPYGHVDGVIAGVISPWPGNASTLVAQETVCFGNKESELRGAFDLLAKHKGCSVSMISCFTQTEKDRFRCLQQ